MDFIINAFGAIFGAGILVSAMVIIVKRMSSHKYNKKLSDIVKINGDTLYIYLKDRTITFNASEWRQ